MMNAYSLPKTLDVDGKSYNIRSDYRVIIDILIAISDPDMEDWERQEVMFQILYNNSDSIPPNSFEKACKKAAEFIDYNIPEGRPKPKTMDWEQDSVLIIPAINKVAGKEVRAVEYLHWWTFLGYFMEIEDGMFSQVLSIRQKKAQHKHLEKWEKEFERNNLELVKLKTTHSAEQQREVNSIEKWL